METERARPFQVHRAMRSRPCPEPVHGKANACGHAWDIPESETDIEQAWSGTIDASKTVTTHSVPQAAPRFWSWVPIAFSAPAFATRSFKFLFAAFGICISYFIYGYLQEDVYSYISPIDGSKFQYAWLSQLLESLANVLVGFLVRIFVGGENDVPLRTFFAVGTSQLFAKTFTSLALAAGLSFPLCTITKSAKMVPVMLGQIVIGGSSYSWADYCVAGAIVSGSLLLSMGGSKRKHGEGDASSTTLFGVAFILIALVMDGITAGLQIGLKSSLKRVGKSLRTNDLMLWANLSMAMTASLISGVTGDWAEGWDFMSKNPAVLRMVLISCGCSVVGQSFVFFMITHFDPFACTAVTTSRKILSVLYSISAKGHSLTAPGAFGVALAVFGLLVETRNSLSASKRTK